MKLINKLNPENLEKLLNNKHESPNNYERALKALTENQSHWNLKLGDVVAVIRMAELDDCAAGILNFTKYFENEL